MALPGLFLLFYLYTSEAVRVIDASSYLKKNHTILGDEFSLGVFDMKFDKDLKIHRAYQYCSNTACHAPTTCPPCDWTDPAICAGTLRGIGDPCPCYFLEQDGQPPLICRDRTTWFIPGGATLQNNSAEYLVPSSGLIIPMHPKPPSNCHSIVIKATAIYGKIHLNLIWIAQNWKGYDNTNLISRSTYNRLCPANPSWGMTLVLAVISDDTITESKVKIELSYVALPYVQNNNPHPGNCSVPPELNGTHQCINDGREALFPATTRPTTLRLVLDPIQRCPGILSFEINQYYVLISKNDPWVSSVNATSLTWRRPVTEETIEQTHDPNIYGFCLQPGEKLYIWIYTSGASTTIMADTSRDWVITEPIDENLAGTADYYKAFLTDTTVTCGNKSFTPYAAFWNPLESANTGSGVVRSVYPTDDVSVFFPAGIWASEAWANIRPPQLNPAPFESRRIIISVILNQRLKPRPQPGKFAFFPVDYEFLTEEEFKTCTVTFNGLIHTTDTTMEESLNITVSQFRERSTFTCDPAKYAQVTNEILAIQAASEDLTKQTTLSLADVVQQYYRQGVLAASNEFYFCQEAVLALANYQNIAPLETETATCVADFRTIDYAEDGCCMWNSSAPYSTCVKEQRFVPQQRAIASFNPAIESCPTSGCARDALATLVISKNSLQDPESCGSSDAFEAETTDLRAYWECMEKIFGPEPLLRPGPKCEHDTDCTNYSSSSTCSATTKRCLITLNITEPLFLQCVYDSISQFTRTFISTEVLQIDTSNPSVDVLQEWNSYFSIAMGCSDPYTPVGTKGNLAITGVRCTTCQNAVELPYAWLYTPSSGRQFYHGGYDCWGQACSTSLVGQSAQQMCAILGCTTSFFMPFPVVPFPGLPACDARGNTSYCGLCENGFQCDNVTAIISVADCNTSTLCVLANGTRIRTVDEAECRALESCTVSCGGAPCPTRDACIAAGSCGDAQNYQIGIFKPRWRFPSVCFFDLKFLSPADPTVNRCGPFRKTIFGCSVYNISQTDCLNGNIAYDPTILKISNLRWRTPAQNEVQCQDYGQFCADDIAPSPTGTFASIYTTPVSSTCQDVRYFFDWAPGRWLAGQPRKPRIDIPRLGRRWTQTGRTGLNLPAFEDAIKRAISKIQTLKSESEMFCKNRYIVYVDSLVCSCIAQQDQSACFGKETNTTGIGVACDEETTIRTTQSPMPHVSVYYFPVLQLRHTVKAPSYVLTLHKSLMRTLLVNYRENTAWAIRNGDSAIIGKVLTDGFAATFNGTIRSVKLCLKLSQLRLDYSTELGLFPILDVATREPDQLPGLLQPANHADNVTLAGDYLCVELEELVSTRIYYFVQRVDGWETVNRAVFTPGEIGYLSVLLFLYCFGLVASTAKFIYLIVLVGGTQIRFAIVLLLMICFFVFRVVLFSMLLSNSLLSTHSTGAVAYLLFEFPILLYFCFVTNYILIWLATLRFARTFTAKMKRNIKIANGISFLFSLAIIVLFLIMIILFETIVQEPVAICNSQVVLFDEDKVFSLLIAYRSIFSGIAIFIGCMLFTVALMFGQLLSDPYFNIPAGVRMRVYAISIIGGLGLIAQAIYFLVITATKITPSNYLSLTILLIVEIIPALLFVFVEYVKKPDGPQRGRTKTRTPPTPTQNTQNSRDGSRKGEISVGSQPPVSLR